MNTPTRKPMKLILHTGYREFDCRNSNRDTYFVEDIIRRYNGYRTNRTSIMKNSIEKLLSTKLIDYFKYVPESLIELEKVTGIDYFRLVGYSMKDILSVLKSYNKDTGLTIILIVSHILAEPIIDSFCNHPLFNYDLREITEYVYSLTKRADFMFTEEEYRAQELIASANQYVESLMNKITSNRITKSTADKKIYNHIWLPFLHLI